MNFLGKVKAYNHTLMVILQELLEKAGLTEKEALVYLSGLELGAQTASTFAKKVQMNRSSVYTVIHSLLNKGLMCSFEKNGIYRFEAVPAERLLNYIDSRRYHFDECKAEIRDLLPRFQALTSPLGSRPKVRYFDGLEGIKVVMEQTLQSTEVLRCYSSLHRWLDSPLSDYIRDYGHRRVYDKKIPLKALIHKSELTKSYLDNGYPKVLFEYRFIPEGIFIVDNEINIYNDKVAIISLKPNDYFGVIVESPQIADTQKSIFELAWMGARKK